MIFVGILLGGALDTLLGAIVESGTDNVSVIPTHLSGGCPEGSCEGLWEGLLTGVIVKDFVVTGLLGEELGTLIPIGDDVSADSTVRQGLTCFPISIDQTLDSSLPSTKSFLVGFARVICVRWKLSA